MNRRPEYNVKQTGKNLRRLRLERGYSAEQVREYIGTGTVQAIYKWERGESFPTLDNFFALLELYQVEPSDVLVKELDFSSVCVEWDRMEQRRIRHLEQYWIRLN